MSEIFYSNLTADHPIIKNHMVQGQYLFPGLAYIDMLYQMARDGLGLDYRKCTLKRLSIFKPLIVSKEKPVRLKITFFKKQKYWSIKAESDEPAAQAKPNLYITAEMHQEEIDLNGQFDVEEMKKTASSQTDIELAYADARKVGLVHSDIFKAKGTVYLTEPGCLIDVQVDEKYREREPVYLFHPVLLDGGGLASSILLSGLKTNNNDLYLPLSYESFYSKEPLPDRCYVRIDRNNIRNVNDIFVMDMDFLDTGGNLIAVLRGITAKLVRNPGNTNSPDKPEAKVKSVQKHKADIEAPMKKVLSKYIKNDGNPIDTSTGFYEMGLESSQLLELVKDIENTFKVTLSPSLLFEYSNLDDLITYLENKLDSDNPSESPVLYEAEDNIRLKPDKFEFYENEPFLQDHLVFGKPALMGVIYPCLVIESFIQSNRQEFPVEVKNIRYAGGPVGLNKDETVNIMLQFGGEKGQTGFKTSYYVNDPGQMKVTCTGDYVGTADLTAEYIDLNGLISQSRAVDQELINRSYSTVKEFKIGPMMKSIESLYVHDNSTIICKVNLTGKLKKGNIDKYIFDPLMLGTCFSAVNPEMITANIKEIFSEKIMVPLTVESMVIFRPMTEIAFIIKKNRIEREDFTSFDAMVLSEEGEMIAEIKNAALKLVNSQAQLKNLTPASNNQPVERKISKEIAIIGVSGRYPGANDLEEFWDNLKSGKDCISEIPSDRWEWKKYYDEDRTKDGKIHCKWGGFIEDVDKFDPAFFNILPREAQWMDPQERLFIECVYKTIEDAGYTRDSLRKDSSSSLGANVGVYAGVMYEEYPFYGIQAQSQGIMASLGGTTASIANRVSYIFNFHGPSMVVNTMCSSSLTAIHLACQSLETSECDAAIAGGVNISIHINKYLALSQGMFISSKGRCESFGKGGDGYVPGEGVGAVLLKPLSKAVEDGDNIYGIIRGSSLNAGGKTSGFSVPNPAAQDELIRKAISIAGLNVRAISYIEAHGTGTALGDPIEISGLSKAFRKHTQDRQFCSIGSVKSNIGHCESAAGIAALTKVLLQLKYRQLVPSLHSKELNPNIDFKDTPFFVQQELSDWKRPELPVGGGIVEFPRIAGISSFGAGGSNAHFVIEEYIGKEPQDPVKAPDENPALIILSARDKEGLDGRIKSLLKTIERERFSDENLFEIAYTLQVGREEMEERLGFIASSISELKEILLSYSKGRDASAVLYRGQVNPNKKIVSILSSDEEMDETIEKWILKKKFGKILDLWTKGLTFNWKRLYDYKKMKRVSLPAYPFKKVKCWIIKDRDAPVQQAKAENIESGNPFSS